MGEKGTIATLRLAREYRLIIIGLAIIVAVSLDRLGTPQRLRWNGCSTAKSE
jgi:hypothetical protein